jgi:protein bicaudal C
MAASLTLEISYPFHSHLIGRCGRTINSVMESTRTRIHFPDQNRIAGQKKSNQVIVRGQIADVEAARQRIRVSC